MIPSPQHHQSQNKIFWPTLLFEAEAQHEPFEKMTIVTAKSEYLIKAREMALTHFLQQHISYTDEDINKLAVSLVKENKIQVFESVKITEDNVFVCIDVDVIDDDTIWAALDMVYEAIENGGSITY